MPRRNQGPRLRWINKRRCYYITWTERGRSRERSTGTADRQQAEVVLGGMDAPQKTPRGPSDPAAILITDVLADYGTAWAEVCGPRPDRVCGLGADGLLRG